MAGREALVAWIERHRRADPTDRGFTVLDELDDDTLPTSAETDARREADPVDDWNGDDAAFTLAVDSPGQP